MKRRTCKRPGCDRIPQKGRQICQACRVREWRNASPLRAAWHIHLWNAKQRGIPVVWSFWEFCEFCEVNDYVTAKKAGQTIHRLDHHEGYSADNCTMLSHEENSRLGYTVERWN